MSLVDLQEIETNLEEERRKELEQLTSDLLALHDIMLEFNATVVEQGNHIDNIADSIESAEQNTVEGVQELTQANVYVRKGRQLATRIAAILGGTSIGTAGFLANPVVGVGTMVVGGAAGWLLTK